jgi:hypothetical protein
MTTALMFGQRRGAIRALKGRKNLTVRVTAINTDGARHLRELVPAQRHTNTITVTSTSSGSSSRVAMLSLHSAEQVDAAHSTDRVTVRPDPRVRRAQHLRELVLAQRPRMNSGSGILAVELVELSTSVLLAQRQVRVLGLDPTLGACLAPTRSAAHWSLVGSCTPLAPRFLPCALSVHVVRNHAMPCVSHASVAASIRLRFFRISVLRFARLF